MDPWAPRQPIAMRTTSAATTPAADRAVDTATRPDDRRLFAARLVHVADVDGALGDQAPWGRIETPLAPYRFLLDTQAREGGPQ